MPLPNMEKREFENQFRDLIGKRIVRVRYYEIEYQDTENMWQYDDRFDSLDFGLDLLCEDNSLFVISKVKSFTNMEYHLIKIIYLHRMDTES